MRRTCTSPFFTSATRSAREASWSTGAASTGSVRKTVFPKLPSASFRAWAAAWTSGGAKSPATTTERPAEALRSFAAVAANFSALSSSPEGRAKPASPSSAPSASAKAGRVLAAERKPVVGERTGRARRNLDGVEAGHLLRPAREAPPGRERLRVANRVRSRGEEVGIEGDDDVGGAEVVAGLRRLAESDPGAGADGVASGRFPLVPLRLREGGEQGLQLRAEGRGGDRLGQDPEAGALDLLLRLRGGLELLDEVGPGVQDPELRRDLEAVGVVEAEDGRLGDRGRAAEAGRMLRVPLDLRRASLVALGEEGLGEPADGHRGGEEERDAGDDLLGLLHVGDDLLDGLARAGRHAGQGHGGHAELEEAPAGEAPVEALVPVGGVPRVLRREELAEAGVVGELFDAAPEGRSLTGPEALADLGEVEREAGGTGREVVRRLGTKGRKAHRGLCSFGPAAHRWQVPQEVISAGGRTLYFSTSSRPSASWSFAFQVML